jgi:hypothetical protein
MNFAEQLKQLQTKGLRRPGRHSPEPATARGFGGREGGNGKGKGGKDPGQRSSVAGKLTGSREKDTVGRQTTSKVAAGSKRKREDLKAGRSSSDDDEAPTAGPSRDPFFAKSKLVARQEDSESEGDDEDDSSEGESDDSGDDSKRKGGKTARPKKGDKKMKEKKDKSRPAELSSKRAIGRARQVVKPTEWVSSHRPHSFSLALTFIIYRNRGIPGSTNERDI